MPQQAQPADRVCLPAAMWSPVPTWWEPPWSPDETSRLRSTPILRLRIDRPDPAPCFKACPAHNDISLALWWIEMGDFLEAARIYRQTGSLSEVCGRVCPHEKLCQGACVP